MYFFFFASQWMSGGFCRFESESISFSAPAPGPSWGVTVLEKLCVHVCPDHAKFWSS